MAIKTFVKSREVSLLLVSLRESTPEIIMSALISLDGILLASEPEEMENRNLFSLMVASLLSLGQGVSEGMSLGKVDQVLIRGKEGYIIAVSIQGKGILCCLAEKQVKLGGILIHMKHTGDQLAEYVHPIHYGTAMLNPEILEEIEQQHQQETGQAGTEHASNLY